MVALADNRIIYAPAARNLQPNSGGMQMMAVKKTQSNWIIEFAVFEMRVKCFGRSAHERQLTRYDLITFAFLTEWKKGRMCGLCTYQACTIRRMSFSATGIL